VERKPDRDQECEVLSRVENQYASRLYSVELWLLQAFYDASHIIRASKHGIRNMLGIVFSSITNLVNK
jgi:hypothetical protein